MSSRSLLLATALCALVFGACSNRYSNVYSFRKNSFKAPVVEKKEVVAPNVTADILAGQGAVPGGAGAIPGIPGAPTPGAVPWAAPTGIPGLDPVPGAAPAPGATPAPAPGDAPAPAPGAAPAPAIPGL